jgi:hypothetical protein
VLVLGCFTVNLMSGHGTPCPYLLVGVLVALVGWGKMFSFLFYEFFGDGGIIVLYPILLLLVLAEA